jgi:hypothetical protein
MKKELEAKATPASYRPAEVLKTLTELLPVPLTDAEKLEVGLQLAQEEGALGDQESMAATVKADLKAREAQIRARISMLSTQLRNGQRLTDVAVEVRADFERNVAVYVRVDNGKEVRSRPLDASERQGLLLPPEAGGELPSGVTKAEEQE